MGVLLKDWRGGKGSRYLQSASTQETHLLQICRQTLYNLFHSEKRQLLQVLRIVTDVFFFVSVGKKKLAAKTRGATPRAMNTLTRAEVVG